MVLYHGGIVCSSPAIGADGTIYVGSQDHKLYALNPNGTFKWAYSTGDEIEQSPAIGSDGTIYVGSDDNNLYALNPNGTFKWSYAMGDMASSSLAIGADGTVYVGSYDHNLYAISPSGTFKWSYDIGGNIWCAPAVGADGTVYVGSKKNPDFYAINSNGTLQWALGIANTNATESWPTIGTDGTVYVGSDNSNLYALYSSSPGPAASSWPMFHRDFRHTGSVATPTTLSLSPGWNLVSLPFQPANAAPSTMLSGISGACEVVWGYPNKAWQVYDPNDIAGSTLTTMQAGNGYWIKMTAGKTLSVSGSAPSSSISLLEGWNLVGYSGTSCVAPATALSSISANLQVSWGYPNQSWQVYDPNDSGDSTLTQLCPNNGYWINVNQAGAWTIP